MSTQPEPQPLAHSQSLLPPVWTLLLTVMMVALCVGALVLALIALGGRTAPDEPARVVVLTSASVDAAIAISSPLTSTLPPTLPPRSLPQALVMAGPTLQSVLLTPTAISIVTGATVRVIDVDDQQLNVRQRPAVIDSEVVFRVPQDELLTIIEGPTQGDGLTWWRVQDNNARTGWAAANYLEVVPTP